MLVQRASSAGCARFRPVSSAPTATSTRERPAWSVAFLPPRTKTSRVIAWSMPTGASRWEGDSASYCFGKEFRCAATASTCARHVSHPALRSLEAYITDLVFRLNAIVRSHRRDLLRTSDPERACEELPGSRPTGSRMSCGNRGRIEECVRDHRQCRRTGNRVVRQAWQDGELRLGPARTVQAGIVLSTAQQAEELDDVLRPDGIGVREHDHGRRLDRGHLLRPVVVLSEQVSELAKQQSPIHMWIQLREWGLCHELAGGGAHPVEIGPDLWVPALAPARL